jgi:hypothetical protein
MQKLLTFTDADEKWVSDFALPTVLHGFWRTPFFARCLVEASIIPSISVNANCKHYS